MPKFKYYMEGADVRFSWDGWMQVMIHPGPSVPPFTLPDRFDIREPDLQDPDLFDLPGFEQDGSVHFVPLTQDAFENLCTTWWRGEEICTGVRDYTAHPHRSRSWGITGGAFRTRYAGGTHIEIAPADGGGPWRPLINLAADGMTPETLSTTWLMNRFTGWEEAWLDAHGITDRGHGLDDARAQWTLRCFPRMVEADCIVGVFHKWAEDTARADLTGERWTHLADLGHHSRHVSRHRPWTTSRRAADGARFNFVWTGAPYAAVYSPDHRLNDHRLAAGDTAPTGRLTVPYLEQQADAWIKKWSIA